MGTSCVGVCPNLVPFFSSRCPGSAPSTQSHHTSLAFLMLLEVLEPSGASSEQVPYTPPEDSPGPTFTALFTPLQRQNICPAQGRFVNNPRLELLDLAAKFSPPFSLSIAFR